MRRLGLVAVALGTLLAIALSASAKRRPPPRIDFAGEALNILVPGENGSASFDVHTNDQERIYDALTPRGAFVADADLARYFKPESFGPGTARPTRVESIPRAGVQVVRDSWGVAHVTARTLSALMFANGWIAAEDRGLLMELLRSAGRLSAIDAPGYNAFAVALTGRRFVPSAQTEAFLTAQYRLLERAGPEGRRALVAIDSYRAGINAYYKAKALPVGPWTRNDELAVSTVLAARFGAGGGDELSRSMFLSALEARLGPAKGRAVWNDLSELNDPEAPTEVPGSFPAGQRSASEPGAVVVDDGSASAPPAERVAASNALLVSAKHSATGHPLFVAGPQVGYYFPEVLLEEDLHGGGIDARGALVPGVPWIVIGRGKDFAWSLTSSNSDIVDQFVETLCGGDDLHYLYQGRCRAMTSFDAGVLKGRPGQPDTHVSFHETVHGPVIGYATVDGRKVAISQERSTRGREILSGIPFLELDENRPTSAKSFFDILNGFDLAFNWVYADSRDIALFSSGRIPVRAPGTDPGLPTVGTGAYDWRGYLTETQHPQVIDPPGGIIVSWNDKPARGFSSADDNWSYGPVQRAQLLLAQLQARPKHTLGSVVAAMDTAATQDLRAVRVLPVIERVLKTGPAPSARDQTLLDLLESWRVSGASRLDANGDGKIDDPGAAILDAVWNRWADAVMSPVLGPLTSRLAALMNRSEDPNPGGSSFYDGWYGYVDKDLRTLLGEHVQGPFATRFCGGGDLATCREALWAALDAVGNELAAVQGPDPAAWRADATKERIRFSPGLLPDTMRWTNRGTFQQVITFTGHRSHP